MNRRLLLLGLLLLIITNAVILARVAYNRISVVDTIQLSERELPIYYHHLRENSGMAVHLQWLTPARTDEHGFYGYRRELQVTEAQAEALGFDLRECSERDYFDRIYQEQKAWVLMELDGQAYANEVALAEARLHEAQQGEDEHGVESREYDLKRIRNEASRLYAIAVASEAEPLLRAIRNPDKQFVVRAVVQQGYGCKPNVLIKQLFIERLHLAKELLQDVEVMPRHYQVDVAIGQLGEAWIIGLQ